MEDALFYQHYRYTEVHPSKPFTLRHDDCPSVCSKMPEFNSPYLCPCHGSPCLMRLLPKSSPDITDGFPDGGVSTG